MTRRTRVLVGLAAVLVLAGAATAVVLWRRAEPGGPGPAARALAPLPPGYRYGKLEEEDSEATIELFKEGYGADDVAVALVGAPQDRAPVGVSVVILHFPDPPDPMALATALERDVTLVDPQPRTLAGQPVLSHHGDETFSSVTLWVRDRLAMVGYGATTEEIDGVLTALILANV